MYSRIGWQQAASQLKSIVENRTWIFTWILINWTTDIQEQFLFTGGSIMQNDVINVSIPVQWSRWYSPKTSIYYTIKFLLEYTRTITMLKAHENSDSHDFIYNRNGDVDCGYNDDKINDQNYWNDAVFYKMPNTQWKTLLNLWINWDNNTDLPNVIVNS